MIDFERTPKDYRHWRLHVDGAVATLFMDVDELGGMFDGYELKLNSYDLGVDIELADIVQRLRFEHPEVGAVVVRSAKDNVFCAGANIRMLGGATHTHKVNFCKFTNETRNTYESAAVDSNQTYICAIKGSCAGGGYELALACNYIILADDAASNVALPEVPLLAVLPGTGGLTRLTDKRRVRRDLADVFCATEEGVRGKRALDWRLVDEIVPGSKFDDSVTSAAARFAKGAKSDAIGIDWPPLARAADAGGDIRYSTLRVSIDAQKGRATLLIDGPTEKPPSTIAQLHRSGCGAWMLRLARELDDAILHLRFNAPDAGLLIVTSSGDPATVAAHERFLLDHPDDWLAREILLYWKRILKRLDVTARSLVALIEPGSCFAGVLAELAFAADRSYMADGTFEGDNRPAAHLRLSAGSFNAYPMANGLSRLATRFLDDSETLENARAITGNKLDAQTAHALGLVTFALDDIDWADEIRLFLEERASFSPDALTAMEANLRFAGPETMETRIFGRLTAWQNWVFQRPNAVGETGALTSYGTGRRARFDKTRV